MSIQSSVTLFIDLGSSFMSLEMINFYVLCMLIVNACYNFYSGYAACVLFTSESEGITGLPKRVAVFWFNFYHHKVFFNLCKFNFAADYNYYDGVPYLCTEIHAWIILVFCLQVLEVLVRSIEVIGRLSKWLLSYPELILMIPKQPSTMYEGYVCKFCSSRL